MGILKKLEKAWLVRYLDQNKRQKYVMMKFHWNSTQFHNSDFSSTGPFRNSLSLDMNDNKLSLNKIMTIMILTNITFFKILDPKKINILTFIYTRVL